MVVEEEAREATAEGCTDAWAGEGVVVGHLKDHSQVCPARAGRLVASDGHPWDVLRDAASCRAVGVARHRGPASTLDPEDRMVHTDHMKMDVIICVGLPAGRNATVRLDVGGAVVLLGEGGDGIGCRHSEAMSSDRFACASVQVVYPLRLNGRAAGSMKCRR